jgi:hypothetical protein
MLACAAGTARAAAPEGEAVSFEYSAPEQCPSQNDFAARVRERVAHAAPSSPDAPARRFVVRIDASPAGFSGHVTIHELDGTTTVRAAEATECAELADGLAFIAALAIDPRRAAREESGPDTARETQTSALRGASEAPSDDGVDTSPSDASMLRFGAGIVVGIWSGVAPDLPITRGAYIRGDVREPGLFTPSVRVSLETTSDQHVTSTEGAATFGWLGGTLEFCSLNGKLAPSLSARPCVLVQAGRLHAQGADTQNPRSSSEPWLAVGMSGEVEVVAFELVSLAISGSFLAPFGADEYVVGSTRMHEVPTATWRAGIRVGALFP